MGDQVTLMFHDVVSEAFPDSGFNTVGALQYKLDVGKFEKFIKFCLNQIEDVVFTFDDGGSSFYNVIAPILEKYDKRGVFFISTGYIDTDGFLTRDQIKKLHSKGHIIASHSDSHPRDISKLPIDEIVNEWTKSKAILENITGGEINVASIPGGAVSLKVLKALKKAGYAMVYTSEPANKAGLYDGMEIYGRYAIKNNSDLAYLHKLLSNPSYRRKLIVKYKFLRLLKSILGSNYNKLKQAILAHK